MHIFDFHVWGQKILRGFSVFFAFFLGYIFCSLFFSGTSVFAEDEDVESLDSDSEYADLIVQMDDLYMNNYEKLSFEGEDEIESKTLDDLSAALSKDGVTISAENVKAVMNGDLKSEEDCFENFVEDSEYSGSQMCFSPLVQKYCTGTDPNNFDGYVECQQNIQNFYREKLEENVFGKRMETYARSHQAFLNGTLKDTNDTKFDIIIDLNILDVILFGDKFTAPANSSPFFPHKSIAEVFQTLEDKKDANQSAGNTSTENSGTSESETTEPSDDDENSESAEAGETPSGENSTEESSNPGNSGNTDENDENTTNENINLDAFCIDPDVLVFSGNSRTHTGDTENSGNTSGNSNEGGENEEGDEDQNTDSGETGGLNISDEEMQNGNYFDEEETARGGEYPDLSGIEQLERDRGYRKDCGERERPLFGGRMCVPEFCTEVFCVRVIVKEGHKQTNLRPLDCVECHIDKGNEALTPLVSTLGQNTPHTNPMEPNFMGAFATFGGAFSGVKVYTQPKKLPFLVYDEGDSLTDQKKEKEKLAQAKSAPEKSGAESENKEDSSAEKTDSEQSGDATREARLQKLIEKNQKILDIMTYDCSSETEDYGNDAQKKAAFCARNTSEMKAAEASGQTTESVRNAEKGVAYSRVVTPWIDQFTEDMRQINLELEKIDPTNITRAGQQCK